MRGARLGLHVDEFVQRRVDADRVTEPFGSPEHHPREVAGADVRGNDPVAQHVRQRTAVVRDRVDVLEGLHERLEFHGVDAEFGGDLAAGGGLHVLGLVDVHVARELRGTVDQFLLLFGVVDPRVLFEERDHVGVDRLVDRRGTLRNPGPALEPVAGVDDVGVHRAVAVPVFHLVLAVGVLLHRHEDERGEFDAAVDNFDCRPGVPAADPRIFDVDDLLEIDAHRVEEAVAEFDGAVLPVDLAVVGVLVFRDIPRAC